MLSSPRISMIFSAALAGLVLAGLVGRGRLGLHEGIMRGMRMRSGSSGLGLWGGT
jgi:hypothetical protein